MRYSEMIAREKERARRHGPAVSLPRLLRWAGLAVLIVLIAVNLFG